MVHIHKKEKRIRLYTSQLGLTLLFLDIAALLLLKNILRVDIVALMLMLTLGLSGAIMMALIDTMSMDQAYHAVDRHSLFLVTGMLPVGVALNKTGASAMFADVIFGSLGNAGHVVLLGGIVLLTVALTQIINGVAAVTVIAPIANRYGPIGRHGASRCSDGDRAGFFDGVYVAARTFRQCW